MCHTIECCTVAMWHSLIDVRLCPILLLIKVFSVQPISDLLAVVFSFNFIIPPTIKFKLHLKLCLFTVYNVAQSFYTFMPSYS